MVNRHYLLFPPFLWLFANDVNSQEYHEKRTTRSFDRERLAPFDKDIRDDCRSMQIHCQSEYFAHVFLQCPVSCSKLLEEEGMVGTADTNPDALWESPSLRTHRGERIDSSRFEGYVMVLAITPLLPGMAVYFYEMLEHLHSVFAPNVEFVLLPVDVNEGLHISLRKNPKVVVLEEESAIDLHPWVQHLISIKPRKGAATKDHNEQIKQMPLHTDRVTIYIVSADGYFVERLISPNMAMLQEKVAMYTKTIDYEL